MDVLNEGTMALFSIVSLDSNKNTLQCLDTCISDLLHSVLLHLLPGITERELTSNRFSTQMRLLVITALHALSQLLLKLQAAF